MSVCSMACAGDSKSWTEMAAGLKEIIYKERQKETLKL